jgi:hypothetical protein
MTEPLPKITPVNSRQFAVVYSVSLCHSNWRHTAALTLLSRRTDGLSLHARVHTVAGFALAVDTQKDRTHIAEAPVQGNSEGHMVGGRSRSIGLEGVCILRFPPQTEVAQLILYLG